MCPKLFWSNRQVTYSIFVNHGILLRSQVANHVSIVAFSCVLSVDRNHRGKQCKSFHIYVCDKCMSYNISTSEKRYFVALVIDMFDSGHLGAGATFLPFLHYFSSRNFSAHFI